MTADDPRRNAADHTAPVALAVLIEGEMDGQERRIRFQVPLARALREAGLGGVAGVGRMADLADRGGAGDPPKAIETRVRQIIDLETPNASAALPVVLATLRAEAEDAHEEGYAPVQVSVEMIGANGDSEIAPLTRVL